MPGSINIALQDVSLYGNGGLIEIKSTALARIFSMISFKNLVVGKFEAFELRVL